MGMIAWALLGAVLLAIAVLAALTVPNHYEDGFRNVSSVNSR